MAIRHPNPEDWCIVVGEEEVQSDFAFQCDDCGADNEPEAPAKHGVGLYVRRCRECQRTYPIQTWTEET